MQGFFLMILDMKMWNNHWWNVQIARAGETMYNYKDYDSQTDCFV